MTALNVMDEYNNCGRNTSTLLKRSARRIKSNKVSIYDGIQKAANKPSRKERALISKCGAGENKK